MLKIIGRLAVILAVIGLVCGGLYLAVNSAGQSTAFGREGRPVFDRPARPGGTPGQINASGIPPTGFREHGRERGGGGAGLAGLAGRLGVIALITLAVGLLEKIFKKPKSKQVYA